MNDLNLQWSVWDSIHEEVEQVKRQKSSSSSKLTPLSLSSDSGVFKGSSKDYYTTLSTCECRDFIVRHKPCKHMYRLSRELDVFSDNLQAETDTCIAKKYRIEEAMDVVSSFSDSDQTTIREILETLLSSEFILVSDSELVQSLIQKSFLIESDKKQDFSRMYLNQNYTKPELLEKFDLSDLPKNSSKSVLVNAVLERFPSIIDTIFTGNILIAASVSIVDIMSKIVYRLTRFSHAGELTETISFDEHKLLSDFRKLSNLQKSEVLAIIYQYLNS